MSVSNKAQVPATVDSTHEMIVSVGIMAGVGMLLVIIAGQSKNAGNVIAGILGIMLLAQGITHVNPFVAFIANHPLTPSPVVGTTSTLNSPGAPNRAAGRMRAY